MARKRPLVTPQLPAEPLLAAAALLPVLEAEGRAGHGPSGAAAEVIRALLGRTPEPRVVGSETLAEGVQRLSALVRAQDAQLVRLAAMLERLL